jgi:oxygen-dependent protoporphyrinogen oxidase
MRPRTERPLRDRRGEPPRKAVVIGAGITGLAAARELLRLAEKNRRPIDVVVLEASPRVGGKVQTVDVGGAVVETGPDSFVTLKPEMLELVKELGLESELIATAPDATVSVLKDGRLLPMPAGMQLVSPTRLIPFAFSPLFSWRAKLRMALEPLVAAGPADADESLADFTRRRLGPEALDRLVAPMLAGIFAGDAERLSVRSAFPQLLELEKRGGLARALWTRAPKRARREGFSTFMTLKCGLSRVIAELERRLPEGCVRTDCPATAVRRRGGRWQVVTPRGTLDADVVICAAPASALADAAEGLDPELALRLREIPFASTATVSFVYDAKSLPNKLPRGFGFLTARDAGTTLTAATFSSSKFPQRAPAGKVVLRAFVGGAGRDAEAEAGVGRIEARVREDLDRVLGLRGAAPEAARVTRWIKANPQYDVGHSRRLERLVSCLKGHPGLVLAGCSYHGVGLPDCVRSGRRAAELAANAAFGRRSHDSVHAGLA